MKILAIETSCDETAIALLEASGGLNSPKFKILKNLVASQIPIHRPFGGVVPGLAKREHEKNLPLLWHRIMNNELGMRNGIGKKRLRTKKENDSKTIIHNSKFIIPNLIAVTVGPGLEPALWTGIEFAKRLRARLLTDYRLRPTARKKTFHRLIGVNHLKGHLYSFLLTDHRLQTTAKAKKATARSPSSVVKFPAVALIVSGGHTTLLHLKDLTHYKKLGETRDDAAGECFDKVARLLELPYPGGPEIEKIAREGNPRAVEFPRPMMHQKNFDFSFSGLKTAVLYYLRDASDGSKHKAAGMRKADVAASFQEAVFDVLLHKTIRAAREFHAKSVILTGGVAANKDLRSAFQTAFKKEKIKFIVPPLAFSTDNAAMIGAAGYMRYLTKKQGLPLRADGTLNL